MYSGIQKLLKFSVLQRDVHDGTTFIHERWLRSGGGPITRGVCASFCQMEQERISQKTQMKGICMYSVCTYYGLDRNICKELQA